MKLHTLLDLHGSIPTVVEITGARTSDNSILAAAFFVVRTRKNMLFRRRYGGFVLTI